MASFVPSDRSKACNIYYLLLNQFYTINVNVCSNKVNSNKFILSKLNSTFNGDKVGKEGDFKVTVF